MRIREVMTSPAATVTTQSPTATALWLMREEQVSSIPVVDDRGTLLGVIDATDLVQDEALVGARSAASVARVSGTTPSRRVGDVMTHQVVTVSPDDRIEVAIALMRSTMLEHVPVVEKDRVVGTVCRSDMIRPAPASSRCCELETSAGTARGADAVRLTDHH